MSHFYKGSFHLVNFFPTKVCLTVWLGPYCQHNKSASLVITPSLVLQWGTLTVRIIHYLKWLPPHSADPLPEFQFRDCGFVVSGTGFQDFRLRSVGISIFPALELPDFKISSFGASRFQYFRLRSSSGASKSRIFNGN